MTQSAASPVANGTFSGTRNGNKISYNRARAAATRAMQEAAPEVEESDPEYGEVAEPQDTKAYILPARRRGRPRRDIYSPEPDGVILPPKSRRVIPGTRPVSSSPRKVNGIQKTEVSERTPSKQALGDADSLLTFGIFSSFSSSVDLVLVK